MTPRLTLASGSPRRQAMLRECGVRFDVQVPDIDEESLQGSDPEELARAIAQAKCAAMFDPASSQWVLAADTVVALSTRSGDWEFLGKPRDYSQASQMLLKLSGITHVVVTAFCLKGPQEVAGYCEAVRTEVTFRRLREPDIASYVATGEPFDKAGSYGIQGMGQVFISSISGSYSNVVGLPLCEVLTALELRSLWEPAALHHV